MVLTFLPFANKMTPDTSATATLPADAAMALDPSMSLEEAIDGLRS